MSEVSVAKTEECERAEDLLHALRPRSDHFKDLHDASRRTQEYIFRGHKDDRLELVPSALRLNVSIKSRFGSWGRVEPNPKDKDKERFVEARDQMVVTQNWTNRDQLGAEVLMLDDFFQFADSSGLPLPEDSRRLRTWFEKFLTKLSVRKADEEIKNWPPSEILSLLALAQHYGVPTRLLDWTRSAYTAAYFAAKGAVQSPFDKHTPDCMPDRPQWCRLATRAVRVVALASWSG